LHAAGENQMAETFGFQIPIPDSQFQIPDIVSSTGLDYSFALIRLTLARIGDSQVYRESGIRNRESGTCNPEFIRRQGKILHMCNKFWEK